MTYNPYSTDETTLRRSQLGSTPFLPLTIAVSGAGQLLYFYGWSLETFFTSPEIFLWLPGLAFTTVQLSAKPCVWRKLVLLSVCVSVFVMLSCVVCLSFRDTINSWNTVLTKGLPYSRLSILTVDAIFVLHIFGWLVLAWKTSVPAQPQ